MAIAKQKVSGKEYLGIGGGHWIQNVISHGEYVVLEDNSLWEIGSLDRIDVALWLPVTDITVIENPNGFLPYLLINTDDGEKAEAKYIGQK